MRQWVYSIFALLCVVLLSGWGMFFANTNGGAPSTITGSPTPTPTPGVGPQLASCTANVGTSTSLPLTLTVNPGQGLLVMHTARGATSPVDPGVTDCTQSGGCTTGSPNQFLHVQNSSDGCVYTDFAPVTSATGSDQVTVASPGSGVNNSAIFCTLNNFGGLDLAAGQAFTTSALTAMTNNLSPTTGTDNLIGLYYIEAATGSFTNSSTNAMGLGTPIDLSGSSIPALLGTSSNTSLLLGLAYEGGVFGQQTGFQRSFTPSGSYCGGIVALSTTALTVSSVAVSPATATLTVGSTQQMLLTATLASGQTEDATKAAVWSSNNTSVATVSAGGLVTASSTNAGSATITGSYGGAANSAIITVNSTGGPPPPPTLTNAAIISPNTTPLGICHINGDDATDDGACIQQILNAGHDLDVKTGVYRINAPNQNTPAVMVPANRTIYCEDTPPATVNKTFTPNVSGAVPETINVSGAWANGAPIAFHTTAVGNIFQVNGNNLTFYGCQYRGLNYPNVNYGFVGDFEQAIVDYPAHGFNNLTIEENDFQGFGGNTGPIAIAVYPPPPAQGGTGCNTNQCAPLTPTGVLISYNSFRASGARGVEYDNGAGQVTHNYFEDSAMEIEANYEDVYQIKLDSNWSHWIFGAAGGHNTSAIQGNDMGAFVCHTNIFNTPGFNFDTCETTAFHPDYSQVTYSNNFLDSAGVQGGFAEGMNDSTYLVQSQRAVFINNGVNGSNAVFILTPGNNNANFWGPGSNQ